MSTNNNIPNEGATPMSQTISGGSGSRPEDDSGQATAVNVQEKPKRVRKKCDHGSRRSRCKECGGSEICDHGRQRSQCKVLQVGHLNFL